MTHLKLYSVGLQSKLSKFIYFTTWLSQDMPIDDIYMTLKIVYQPYYKVFYRDKYYNFLWWCQI